MIVNNITAKDLCRMTDQKGIILQGQGGSLDEWADGINELLTQAGVLLDGTKFTECSSFLHNDLVCLLFLFTNDVKLDMGKLAAWRLESYESFSGTWLPDYIQSRLGGYVKPTGERAAKH